MAHYVCQERYGPVISKHGKQTERIARFLKPCAKSSDEAERASGRAYLLFEEMRSREKGWPKKVNFQGWACPQKKWGKWVEKLGVQHCVMWKQTGIYDAIMSSCCEIRRNREVILGLVEFWCSEMNTFVFPWGEATITLEDMMILGGFSVLGEPVKRRVTTGDLMVVVDVMRAMKSAFSRGRSKRATYGAWMKHFMENENDNELEHVAFLSLWLSRYVFPLPARDIISKDVFPIAAHLAGGTRVALAPAVLAGLYKNLSLLKKKAISSYNDDEITVFAPFKLVLLWAFEHFPQLVQPSPCILKPGEPRAARWCKVICKMDKSVVNSIFLSGQCFQWRPYAADISNWDHSSYYRVEKHLEVDREKNSDQNLQCYLICMTMCYLVGLDCQERYMPHRVAMQFGIDQDLPGEFSELDFGSKDVNFFVPPRSFEAGVSLKYFNWWKNSEFICGGKVANVLRRSLDTFQMPPVEGEMSSKDCHTPSLATRLKNTETVSQPSIKYKVMEVQDNEWEAGSLERRPPSMVEVKGGGGSCILAKSFGSGGPEYVRSHASVTSEFSPTQRLQDSVETDHAAVTGTPKKMAKDSKEADEYPLSDSRHRTNGWSNKATKDEHHLSETIRKRKLCSSTEESSDCRETVSMMNGNTDELLGECVDERSFEIHILDLEKRIEELEKQMGVSPDGG